MCWSLRLGVASQPSAPRVPLDLSNLVTSARAPSPGCADKPTGEEWEKKTSHFHQFVQCHSDPGGQGEKPQWAPWRGQTPVTLASALDTLHGPLLTASAIQSFKIARSLQVPHHVTRPKPCRVLELAPWPPRSLLYCPCKHPRPTCWRHERLTSSFSSPSLSKAWWSSLLFAI